MITCEKYHAVFYDGLTCIARVTASKKAAKLRDKGIYGSRSSRIYEGCEGCKIGEELYKNRKKEKKMEFKTCKKCGEKKPLDRKHFYRNKSKEDGWHDWCKVCHNISSGKVPLAEAVEIIKPIEQTTRDNKIILDFTKYPDVLEKVRQWADDNMRDVDKQILYTLKSGTLNF